MFSDADIAELRHLHQEALFDTCVPLTYAGTSNAYGTGPGRYTAGEAMACLFSAATVEETAGQVQRIDGTIRLSRETVINNLARLKITHLHGDKLAIPQTYDVVSGPVIDHVGQTVKVRLVTDGS